MTTTQGRIVMDGLPALAKEMNAKARSFKDAGVKELDPAFDIPPRVEAYRGGFPLIEIQCLDVDRDRGLHAFRIAAAMDIQAGTLTTDAHTASTEINPKTGERWGPGEMQQACDDENACDAGLLTDCIATFAMGPKGDRALYSAPYHVHKTARTVAWQLDQAMSFDPKAKGEKLGGFVADSMFAAFQDAKIQNSLLTLAGFGLPPAEVRASADMALLRILNEDGHYKADYWLPTDPIGLQICRESIAREPLEHITFRERP